MSRHGHHRSAEWAAVKRKAKPIIAANLPARCINKCQLGGVVYPHQRWDVSHIVDVAKGGTDDLSNLGAAHIKCNRSDGGTEGATITNRARARRVSGEVPSWRPR